MEAIDQLQFRCQLLHRQQRIKGITAPGILGGKNLCVDLHRRIETGCVNPDAFHVFGS